MKRVIAALLLLSAPAQAQVSSTAAPVANSSGSVTNQAVQVVPSRQFTNTYGGGISCQGATLNINPFLSSTTSFAMPYEAYYDEPVYDPDNPGQVLYYQPIRTGQKNNLSFNGGITATISVPLDRHHVKTCRAAAEKQVALLDAKIAMERMVYEIKRVKNCADLMKDGIVITGIYAQICKDVALTNPPGVLPPHTHPITYPKPASDREWLDSGDAAAPVAPVKIPVSPYGQVSD
jgi:hypothetical protein